jgi:Xaa-Pro aminopeptidase
MILMDAGCEYKGYTSDITRVWPVSGKFSPVQKLVYEAVLNVQQELIAILEKHEDLITVDWLYHQMQEVLGQHLVRLGLVKAGLSEIELKV